MNLVEALKESPHTTAMFDENDFITVVDGSTEDGLYSLSFFVGTNPVRDPILGLTLDQILAHAWVSADKDKDGWEPHTEEI